MTVNFRHRLCGGVAFTYDHEPQIGERFPLARHVTSEPRPHDGDVIVCQSCGKRVHDFHADLLLGP